MFKLSRHSRSDRIGDKVEFRLSSFQAFQVPKGWDRLVLSVVSVDTGRTIAKANKATVRSGTCQWTETFSESMWVPQDDASKEIEDYLLKIVVSMGSQRSGVLGEVVLNLTDYLSTRDTGSLPLPLQKCNYSTVFQVRIQCLNPLTRFRGERNLKETSSYSEGLHNNNDDVDSKSDISDNMLNKSLGSSTSNNFGATYPDDPMHRETSFSASGSHHSSDSGDSSVGRLNFSPRNNLNGGSYVGRQDSSGSHLSVTSFVGPTDDFSRSNPSSFNSRASGTSIAAQGLASISLRPAGASRDFIEAAEETIEDLQDEAKMWERHAQKLKLEVEKFKKESSEKSKHQAELDMELSAAYSERDSLKQEVEQLRSALHDAKKKQSVAKAAKNIVMLRVQKELEDEVKVLKESNANLSLQLKKIQEANIELLSISEELEETIEKQRLEMAKLPQQSPESDPDVEAKWASKLSSKEEEISKLKEMLSKTSNGDHADLLKEIEVLRGHVQELEKDCGELTDENLDLILKLRDARKDTNEANDPENFESEIALLESHINRLEEQLKKKEMLTGGPTESSSVRVKDLEKKCADLEVELQYFKDQVSDLEVKLCESQQKLDSFVINDIEHVNEFDIEELKVSLALKEQEIDALRDAKEELEVLISNLQRDRSRMEEDLSNVQRESNITSKCLEDVQNEMMLLTSSVDSHASTNKMLEKQLMELQSSKHQVEDENIQLLERVSGLETQLSHLTKENESNKHELEDSKARAENLDHEVAELQTKIEGQESVNRQKHLDGQEEVEYHKESLSKLQATMVSLIEENNLLKMSNGDLELQLSDSQKKISEFMKRIDFLEVKLSSLQNEIVLKEKSLISKLESILQDHEVQEEIISQTKSMLNQIDVQKTVEIESLQRGIAHLTSQMCATDDEREKMQSDAVVEVSCLRTEKVKLESSLHEAQAKVKLYETELQSFRQESGKKVQGLVDLLNASKQSEEALMSDIEHLQRQAESAKSSEEKFKRVASELELEKEQAIEEISCLKDQLQKIDLLQDEVLVLKSSLEEVKLERGKLEESLQSVSKECEVLKTEKASLMDNISNMQKLHDGELERCKQDDKETPSIVQAQDLKSVKHANAGQTKKMDDSKLHELVKDLKAKNQLLENDLAEAVETNNMYKIQLQGLIAETQSNDSNAVKKGESESDKGVPPDRRVASLEAELKEMRDRYLQMSLQYAEVEAQREEMVMKLKNMTKKGWFS